MAAESANQPASGGDEFVRRHIGPRPAELHEMLATLGCATLDELSDGVVPPAIRLGRALALPGARSETEAIAELRRMAGENRVLRSMIGQGYYDCITPPVIQRNILENPGWYTQYTPYQAEIAQGRLEALLNFQTMVSDLTGLPVASASLLDEATAAAEAMQMCHRLCSPERHVFIVADDCHSQTATVVATRAKALGIEVIFASPRKDGFFRQCPPGPAPDLKSACGILLQYPATDGSIHDYGELIERAHAAGALVVVATDLLACTLIRPPGEFGADIVVGSAQRFGVPMGFGGPHAAFMSTRTQYARQMPGRIVGVSKDARGRPAYRLAIQTREQHIRRERATSNICTAQVLLAIMAGMYATYHGPDGLRRIAGRVHRMARILAAGLTKLRHPVENQDYFDTLCIHVHADAKRVVEAGPARGVNLGVYGDTHSNFTVSADETTTLDDIQAVFQAVVDADPELGPAPSAAQLAVELGDAPPAWFARQSPILAHAVFNRYHSEHEMLRYIKRLESRDLSLAHSMISLGSCTMKLNATSEMLPVTWPEFAQMHPYAPAGQARGYLRMFGQLESWLAEITGLAAVSLQPNAGSQGEYAGLLAIRAYHESRGQAARRVCLIPTSAHGTNPASAVMAGFEVVPVTCDAQGNIDVSDLRAKAEQHAARLGALMVTYPSTHGVFEESIREMCEAVHRCGGQVYLDGANMNAQVGLCRPGDIGADVCHLNLHKTFCIPHGGGGPGMGPICVAKHLAAFLPGNPRGCERAAVGPVSAAAYGSASILTIPWVYIALMGAAGLKQATQVAILNANYMAKRLAGHYPVLYVGRGGRVAHEFILDCRAFEKSAGVKIDDIAKRLMDYGFHAPTMSFPVPGTLMIEPTESESRGELDRFCDALIAIRAEIRAIEEGRASRDDNVLKGAPHTALDIASDEWPHAYGRALAAFPAEWVREQKFWPAVGRIDNVFGDRNLVCNCPTVEEMAAGGDS